MCSCARAARLDAFLPPTLPSILKICQPQHCCNTPSSCALPCSPSSSWNSCFELGLYSNKTQPCSGVHILQLPNTSQTSFLKICSTTHTWIFGWSYLIPPCVGIRVCALPLPVSFPSGSVVLVQPNIRASRSSPSYAVWQCSSTPLTAPSLLQPCLGPTPSCEDRCSGRLLSSAAQSCRGPPLSSLPSSGRL